MKKFQTVYDFHHTVAIPAFGYLFIIPVIVGVCIFIYNLLHGDRESIKFGMPKRTFGMIFAVVFAGIGLSMFGAVASASANKYYSEKSYFDGGKYKTVEGRVENFHPMPAAGHDTEHFDVNSVHFDYSSNDLGDLGYNATQVDGGIMKSGLYVRLTYITDYDRNAILKIDTLLH
jgi:hypothetical protein